MSSDLADRIRARLKALGLSPRKASLMASGSDSLIRNILDGKSASPRAENLEQLARVLKTSEVWLLRGEGPEERPAVDPRSNVHPTAMTELKSLVKAKLALSGRNPFEAARAGGLERSFVNDILIGKKDTVTGSNIAKLAVAIDAEPTEILAALVAAADKREPKALVEPYPTEQNVVSGTVSLHASKQPRRPHHIEDWANKRGMKQAELARELGADKSLVSRWYAGSSPSTEWQSRLAQLFHTEPEGLFRHPDDEWIACFLRGREREEIERIKATLEVAFPRRVIASK